MPLEMQPNREYVGVICVACDRSFPIAGPLEAPAGKPVKIGARHPLDIECPFCAHKATYPVDRLRRIRGGKTSQESIIQVHSGGTSSPL
ncbi:MAG TPA: hypothetical protein VHY35_02925 [Stellaceae bacterium]|nr:hypothetical protein [Stellaceae bacterium]